MGNIGRRLRGGIGMGIVWAVSWALFGLGIGVLSLVTPWLPWELFFAVFDAPLPALAIPGFVSGMAFSIVLGTLGRNRRFTDLSLPGFATWGALAGLAIGSIPFVINGGGSPLLWLMLAVPGAVLGAMSATGSLAIARKGERLAIEDADDPASLPDTR